MSKLGMVVFIFTTMVLVAEISQHVHARPGPLGLSPAEILSSTSSRRLMSVKPFALDSESVNVSERHTEKADSEEELEEELDALCMQDETCDERRLLTASIDYKTDGPNNPITEPPH